MPLPLLFEIGVDPPQKILSVTVFFPTTAKKDLIAAAPAPLRAKSEATAIYGCTEEWPDADVKRAYGKGGEDDDDEATDAEWAAFFKDTGRWLVECEKAGALFALISAEIEITGYKTATRLGLAAVYEVIIPQLTRLLKANKGDGILFGNLAFGAALRLRGTAMGQEGRAAIVELGEAAIEANAHGVDVWQDLLEEVMPSARD